MNASRFLYRSRQFWHALSTRSSKQDLALISDILTDSQFELFQRLQPSEQAHSLGMLNELRDQGEEDPDLLTAALLHDVGKTHAPLRIWERVMIVIVRSVCRDCIRRWGTNKDVSPGSNLGWRRAFIIAEQHPAWGAELAAECGTSPLAVSLIARHQDLVAPGGDNEEEVLLHKLQSVDDNN